MIAEIAARVRDFRSVHALVVGEAMLDSYVRGDASRLSREAPVPIVSVTGRTDAPGGAANTAVNVATLGGQAALDSVVGRDDEADGGGSDAIFCVATICNDMRRAIGVVHHGQRMQQRLHAGLPLNI